MSSHAEHPPHAAPHNDVGVLTFHRCINYGSYWQARCLVEGLRRRGRKAVLLDHASRRVDRREWRCAFQPLAPARTRKADLTLYRRKIDAFNNAVTALPLSRRFSLEDTAGMESCELIVVGSDEVWNQDHPWYAGHPLFYGEGLRARRLVSYAASFGNQDSGQGLDDERAAGLRRFEAISVRDENSQRLVEGVLGYRPRLVLDPCLQFPPGTTNSDAANSAYAVVYGHSFPRWFSDAVRMWANSHGVELVSIGYRNAWAGRQRLSAGPEEFARLMSGARAVATNFFHGCIFALLNRRPFVCASSDYRRNKVRDLTRVLGAQERLVTADTKPSEIADLLDDPIGAKVLARIEQLRTVSSHYLDAVLG